MSWRDAFRGLFAPAVTNGDPAYHILEAIFRRHGLSTAELSEAYRALRAAIIRETIACHELCEPKGCDCAKRIRRRMRGIDGHGPAR